MKFFLKPDPIEAVQVTIDQQHSAQNEVDIHALAGDRANRASQHKETYIVELPTGSMIAHPGEWIAKHKNGDLAVLTDAQLLERYEAAAFSEEQPASE